MSSNRSQAGTRLSNEIQEGQWPYETIDNYAEIHLKR